MRKDKDESRVCYLLVNSGASNPSPGMVELVHRLSRLDIQLLTAPPQFSQIHMPSSIPGISVLFPVPEDRKSGVMKQIQDNMRGIEKKITQSEKKLAGIRKNLANPMFLTRASKEVCERERSDEKVVSSNIDVLKKNLKDLECLLQFNHCRVSSNKTNSNFIFHIYRIPSQECMRLREAHHLVLAHTTIHKIRHLNFALLQCVRVQMRTENLHLLPGELHSL